MGKKIQFTKMLRKNMGVIISGFGFLLLCILTFGDIGEILSVQYWRNVANNLTSIGFMTVSLVMIQVSIKQGLGEQALQKGLNTPETTDKYMEHKEIIKSCAPDIMFMPYFLQNYNDRHTTLKKREFLINNNYKSEEVFLRTAPKRLIAKYNRIRVYLTLSRIKWATTDIIYNKNGQITTLAEHRTKRLGRGIFISLLFMIGTTLLARGLFFDKSDAPLIEKFIKLFTYILSIGMTSIPIVMREYEKGAFGVPNELEELNNIWMEFKNWKIPVWVIKEVKEVKNEENEGIDSRTNIQTEQKTLIITGENCTNDTISVLNDRDSVSDIDITT